MNFANVNGIMIPVNGVQKEVASITDSLNRVIWQKNTIDYTIPFYFKNKGSRGNIGVRINKTNVITQTIDLQYSYDLQTWTNCSISNYAKSRSFDLGVGETIYFRGTNDGWSINSSGSAGGTYQNGGFYHVSNLTNLEVGGNIMSLLFGSNFATQRSLGSKYTYTFNGLMEGSLKTKITKVDNLLLPATTLNGNCYKGLLSGSAITSAPELPATTLASSCYSGMFQGCSSLVVAPTLRAGTLTTDCYGNMFNGCTSLEEVHMLATTWDTGTDYWLTDVAETGTFYMNPNAEYDPLDYVGDPSGIPENWDVRYEGE